MGVVARGDDDEVDVVAADHLVGVGGRIGEAEPRPRALRRQAGRGGDDRGLDARAGQPREDRAGGEVARADQAEAGRAGRLRDAPLGGHGGRCRSPVALVLEHHADQRPLGLERLERALGLVEGEAVRDHRVQVDQAAPDQVQERLHVALLGPAHVADRVVDAPALVVRVVAAGAVGARQAQVELLHVERLARHLHAHVAHHDHRGAVAGQAGGQLDRVGGPGGGAEQDRVGARLQVAARVERRPLVRLGSGGAGQPDRVRVEVDGQDAAAGRERDPHRELADDPEPDDHDGRADGRVGAAEAVHRDRAERGERRVLGAHALGDPGAQQRRDDVDLRVVGAARARDRDTVAGGHAACAGADLDDGPGRAVAERAELVQPLAHELDRRADALAPRALDDLAGLLRARPGLADQALLRDLERRPLRARADHRRLDRDRHGAGAGRGVRDRDELEAAVSEPPCYLPHGLSTRPCRAARRRACAAAA